jgi:hypothetical protein
MFKEENSQLSDITFYLSIISSFLLAISEILPYISKIDSNGILQLIISMIRSLNPKNEYIQLSSDNILDKKEDTENLYNSINYLINELKSYKNFLELYLDNKKINITIS